MDNQEILAAVKGGLIVSCQALPEEPLHSSFIMGRMAYAAVLGGAVGIRANSAEDIREIKTLVKVPVIGIIKREYPDSGVYITPTLQEVDALVSCGCEMIAADATSRPRPGGVSLDEFFRQARQKYPRQLFMADCSCYEEGLRAAVLGFDLIGTTLSGYTPDTKGTPLPDFTLMERLCAALKKPVIAEGGIWSPEELKKAIDIGAHAAVVGTAITRTRELTRHYAKALGK